MCGLKGPSQPVCTADLGIVLAAIFDYIEVFDSFTLNVTLFVRIILLSICIDLKCFCEFSFIEIDIYYECIGTSHD